MDFRILSIGATSKHELWEHDSGERTPHATCTLVRSDDAVIVVDPGMPPAAVAPLLMERAGVGVDQVTHVFLTTFRPAHRIGLSALPNAKWMIAEAEREAVGKHLVAQFQAVATEEAQAALRNEIELLRRFEAAPDKLASNVDLFPLPGYSPGTCGLLLSFPSHTTLIAGDAVITGEHLLAGRVGGGAYDHAMAEDALREAIEIAEQIVPGHDNVLFNPTRRPF